MRTRKGQKETERSWEDRGGTFALLGWETKKQGNRKFNISLLKQKDASPTCLGSTSPLPAAFKVLVSFL